MIKLTKKLILATVAFPLILVSASVFADGDGPGALGPGGDGPGPGKGAPKRPPMGMCRPIMGPEMMGGFGPHMMKELHLSDAQKAKLKALRIADMKERKATQEDHEKRMNSLLFADKFDKSAADSFVIEMENTRVKHQVAMLEKQFKILHILTPEQKAEFMKLKKKRMQQCAESVHHRLDKERKKP